MLIEEERKRKYVQTLLRKRNLDVTCYNWLMCALKFILRNCSINDDCGAKECQVGERTQVILASLAMGHLAP